jgi:hypothetical protein
MKANSYENFDMRNPQAITFWKKLLNLTEKQLRKIVKICGKSSLQVMNYVGDQMDERYSDEFFYYH